MKRNDFDSIDAYKIYADYIKHVRGILSVLPQNDELDIVGEIDSHIYEFLIDNKNISEEECIKTVIRNLGSPESYLKPIIVEKLHKKSNNKYSIIDISNKFRHFLLKGCQNVISLITCLFILAASFIVITKIVYPNQTGLFIKDGNYSFGYSTQMNSEQNELLGYWIIPIFIVLIIILYFLNRISKKI